MTQTFSDYTPAKVWEWNTENGGQFANINRPIAGAQLSLHLADQGATVVARLVDAGPTERLRLRDRIAVLLSRHGLRAADIHLNGRPVAATTSTGSASNATATTNNATSSAATSAFGLSFDALLKIILTQLTYQDPLKPMDNFQFVSQLAQFSQIQIGQTTNDKLAALVSAQGSLQAAGLLGKRVDVGSGTSVVSGKVTAVSFSTGTPLLTILTDDKSTISSISLSSVSQIREP
eukprot:gene41813-56622_t